MLATYHLSLYSLCVAAEVLCNEEYSCTVFCTCVSTCVQSCMCVSTLCIVMYVYIAYRYLSIGKFLYRCQILCLCINSYISQLLPVPIKLLSHILGPVSDWTTCGFLILLLLLLSNQDHDLPNILTHLRQWCPKSVVMLLISPIIHEV